MPIKYKVLLIGSGLMTPPLIDHLLSFKDTHITVVSNLLDQAKALCARGPEFMDFGFLDVTDVSRTRTSLNSGDFSKPQSASKSKGTTW